jgi:integrase
MLVAAGIDPKVVQQRMGHESIETTLKYYAQPTKERREAAAQVAVQYLSEKLISKVDC